MPGPHSWLDPPGPWRHNPELFSRWLQAGVFQPIFRIHMCCSGSPLPWDYPNFSVLQQAFHLRNSLVPYLYTASYASYLTGVLPVHPLYYQWPEMEEPYELSRLDGPTGTLQHMFGDDFVVAPITAFADENTGKIKWPVWVPPGSWVDWWDGSTHVGPTWTHREYSAYEIPLLVKSAAVIPMKTMDSQKELIPSPLVLAVAWGLFNRTGTLYEDGGSNLEYQIGAYCVLRADFAVTTSLASLSVQPCVDGKGFAEAPETRSYLLRFRGAPSSAHNVVCSACPPHFSWYWEMDGPVSVLVVATTHMSYKFPFVVSFQF